MNDIYSFYQLISKYQIEIPIIQRDYAQGRNNLKAEDVRRSMVEKIIKAVRDDNEPLFFDFVYGRIDGNKFIPFDGQQRLTTLYLFHKYVFEKCQTESECKHKGSCICKDILSRFSYATRQSSREFCEKIVEVNIIPTKKFEEKTKEKEYCVSHYIKNQPWFFPYWEKDPTVAGMIMMLDEIHKQMKSCDDFRHFAERLTSGCNCPITFHFVDMGEHKLSDETYVKMNARGKTLTPFENFKASLEQYLDGINNDLLSCFKDNVDGKWLDLFWNVNDNVLPDSYMMSFVNRHFMNVWRCWYGQNTKSEKDRKDMSEDEREEQLENDKLNQRIIGELLLYPTQDDFVSWDIYKGVLSKCGVEDCLNSIFNIWNKLCDPNNTISEDCQAVWNRGEMGKKWNLFEGEKNKENRETYPSRVVFYALMRYFREDNNNAKTTLSQWMRVVWNIIENSSIDENAYQAALRLMNKLSEKCYKIYDAMANHFEEFELGTQYLAQEQVKEEVDKAKQIVNGCNDWENKIIEAEKYAFFKGAIRFLFTDGEGNINWCDDFDRKWSNAQNYFDEKGVVDNDKNDILYKSNALLMKSLLANCDDFGHKIWWHFEFSDDAIHWKRILTSNNWRKAVDVIMSKELTDNITKQYIDNIKASFIKNIVDDGLMDYVCKNMSGAWIRSTYHGYHAIWKSGNPSCQIVLNPILAQLKSQKSIAYHNDNNIENCRYYQCKNKNVLFKYNNCFFQWRGNPNGTQLDIYLMENEWKDYKKRPNPTTDKDTDEDKYYCFNVTKDMESDTSKFTHALDNLIKG